MKNFKIFPVLVLLAIVILTGCDKSEPYDTAIPPAAAHFVGPKTQIYTVETDPAPVKYVQIGTTDVVNVDRTVTVNVTSISGAIAGTDYTITTPTTVTIKAGKAIDSIGIQANFASYPAGTRDTLIITLSQPALEPATFMDTVRLIIAGPTACDETNINLNTLLGAYTNTNEDYGGPYGPYTTTVSAVNQTSPTTGTITVQNIFNDGWGPLTFSLDWTDPLDRKVIAVANPAISGSDAGFFGAAYAGQTVAMIPPSASLSGPGTFSVCSETITLKMILGVTGVGYSPTIYTVVMER